MALTLPANWVTAMSVSGPEIVCLVEIEYSATVTLKASCGRSTVAEVRDVYMGSVSSITPVSTEMDHIVRSMSVSTLTVTLSADGWGRAQHVAYYLTGKKMTIKVGTSSLALADYATVFVGVIDDGSPRACADGTVVVKATDPFGILRDCEITNQYFGQDAFTAMIDVFELACLPASMYDSTTSINPATAANATVAYMPMTYNDTGTKSCLDVVQDMVTATGGCLRGVETGVLQFVPWNASAAASFAWADADIVPDSLEIVEQGANIINRVEVTIPAIQVDDIYADEKGKIPLIVRQNDTVSQVALKAYGSVYNRVFNKNFDLRVSRGVALLKAAIASASVPAVGSTFDIYGPYCQGVAGAAWPSYPSGSQPAWAQLTDTNTLYVKINDEIIEVDRCTVDSNATSRRVMIDHETGERETIDGPWTVSLRVKARGALGTTAASHIAGVFAYDITMAEKMCTRLLARQNYGNDKIKFKTLLSKFAAQIGDIGTFTSDRVFSCGDASLGSDVKWEVTGKDAVFVGDDIGITWTLTTVDNDTPTITHLATADWLHGFNPEYGVIARDVMDYKLTGGLFASTTGLGIECTALSGTYGSLGIQIPAFSCQVADNKTTYFYFDGVHGSWIVITVGYGGGPPTTPANCILRGMAQSLDGSVEDVADYGATNALQAGIVTGTNIATSTVSSTHLAAASVTPAAVSVSYYPRSGTKNRTLEP